jgi:hypothetical protein
VFLGYLGKMYSMSVNESAAKKYNKRRGSVPVFTATCSEFPGINTASPVRTSRSVHHHMASAR